MFSKITITLVAAAMAFVQVCGESHTVTFTNECGYGTPYLWGPDGVLLSTGDPYTSNGPADGLIAYLQTGNCGDNGEYCLAVEANLSNAGSSAYISDAPPHEFSVATGFGYYNGCDGLGADCTYNGCPSPAYQFPLPPVVCPVANTGASSSILSLVTMFLKLTTAIVAAAMVLRGVRAETHTVHFTNNCGYGTPYLWGPNGVLLSTGGDYTVDGPAPGLIAYLQYDDRCGNNGEDCTLIEATLTNEGNSAADISLIPPHEFSVTSGFGFYNGCDGAGADCTYEQCLDAFHQPGDTGAIVSCSVPNVDLAITFCD
ncbi:uncharacterized protein FIBRA_04714 [Fibroporia radiculosa]|uniref:Glycopeptide n=1 Tax=Fibroporia radiculosa TaxID=599839 RepID=J4IAB3_9APHY|nr:uncharacterized protein FIBRA_04714 [Fibroporia radiculosa]CCM02611.1 predicted protein [Fibroporia radiculosa]